MDEPEKVSDERRILGMKASLVFLFIWSVLNLFFQANIKKIPPKIHILLQNSVHVNANENITFLEKGIKTERTISSGFRMVFPKLTKKS